MPEPPFHARTFLSPFSASLSFPASIDWKNLTGSAPGRAEVSFCENVEDTVERERAVDSPVLVDATGRGESVYTRGAELTRSLLTARRAVVHVASVDGGTRGVPAGAVLAIAAWPPDPEQLKQLCSDAANHPQWGVIVPVVAGATTDLELLSRIVSVAAERGARFIAAEAIDTDPAARSRIALDRGNIDDEEYSALFDGRDETLLVATERHVAALAAERGIASTIPHPGGEPLSNWNAAALLTLYATRMLRMERDVELAWLLQRSARVVADLGKPLRWIAESANLSIVQELDEVSVEILDAWLQGERAMLVRDVDEAWPLRRDDYR